MNLEEYRTTINFPLKKLTVAYPITGGEVLLGKKIKKGGLGEGYYLGIGGKVEEGESWEESAIREIKEEIGITPKNLNDRGFVHFYFPGKENKEKWNFRTKIYVFDEWEGSPMPSDEMVPHWFPSDQIPYEYMWDDNKYFIPHILEGKSIEAHVLYDQAGSIVEEFSIRFLGN